MQVEGISFILSHTIFMNSQSNFLGSGPRNNFLVCQLTFCTTHEGPFTLTSPMLFACDYSRCPENQVQADGEFQIKQEIM